MARSFNDLIDFLLSEIALCGDQGASPSDILTFIDAFYKRASQDGVADTSGAPQRRIPVINRPFQERIWSWLTRNPEVSVGKNREWNHLSLTEAEERLSETSRMNKEGAPIADSLVPDTETKPPISDSNEPPLVFVSEERTWFAITGHGPDVTKVLPTEFALLSIIASRKSRGIVQTELVRLSGQDKRSVPKRTDVLQQKGYIEKRAIQVKSSRTSLCTLRKFVQAKPIFDTTETPEDAEIASRDETVRILDFKVFTDKLFEVLKEHGIIARNDLKRILGFNDLWRWKILSRALRKFERIGVLKRVRAMSQYADTMKALHPCVMLIREPSERDLQLFHEDSRSLFANLEQEGNASVELEEDLQAEAERTGASGSQDVGVVTKEGLEEAGRMLPTWNPDRNVYNLIFETIDSSGTVGKTNIDTIRVCFGGFFRRPLENALARLVECWQLSQPPHLRHLALVRDTALSKTITHYVHYSARNFTKLIESGQASWEAVEFIPRDSKSGNIKVPPVDAVPEVDELGFPLDNPSKDLFRKGDVTLLECIIAAKPADYFRSNSDPVAVMLEDGSYVVRDGRERAPAGALERLKTPSKPRGRRPKRAPTEGETPEETVLLPKGRAMPEVDLDDIDEDTVMPAVKRYKLSKYDPERYPGMSEKEMLEAMGLDETWTEYNILLMERPRPGVYVTPRGRRRPAGRRQGRPRISQIAIFKSPKLRLLPWFSERETAELSTAQVTAPGAEVTESVAAPAVTPQHLSATSPVERSAGETGEKEVVPASNNKRTFSERDVEAVPTPTPVKRRRGRPPKKPRIETPADEDTQEVVPSLNQNTASIEAEKEKADDQQADHRPEPISPRVTRKRGRPRKKNIEESTRVTQEAIENEDGNRIADIQVDERPQSPVEETQPRKRPRILTSAEPRAVSPDTVQTTEAMPVDDTLGETSNAVPQTIDRELREEDAGVAEGGEPHALEEMEEVANTVELEPEPEPEPEPLTKVESAIGNKDILAETPNEISGKDLRASEQPLDVSRGESVQETEQKRRVKKVRMEKGGSVAMLRRKIVMDILEKAGGAFPLGTELWYPFTTAWLKTKYTEKPDLRTIRSTVKHMVDAGKLRQLTFSGLDDKGIMVTKTMITKPDLPVDDPQVKDLQQKMLAAGSRFYFPPNVEINPDLTKSGNRFAPARGQRTITSLPVQEDITVQLHQKPAFVVAQEKRKGRSIQRRLLRGEGIPDKAGIPQRKERVVRLMKIQRPSNQDIFFNNLTSISRPGLAGIENRRRMAQRVDGRLQNIVTMQPRRMKRIWNRISTMAPHAMLMNPVQNFHAVTGTFSTDAGLEAYQRLGLVKEITGPSLPQSVDDIISRTRRHKVDFSAEVDPRSSKFFLDNDAIARWEIQNEELFDQRADGLRYINQTVNGFFDIAPLEGDIRFDFEQPIAPPEPQPIPKRVLRPRPRLLPAPPPGAVYERPSTRTLEALTPQNRRLSKLNEIVTAEEVEPEPVQEQRPSARFAVRRNRFIRAMPDNFVRKITTAMVVVRTLAGGVEGKMIDWDLVSKAFPGRDPKFIQDSGKTILNKSRLQMAKMQSDFQDRFIEAYENDEVPGIDYGDLGAYDWEWVVNWADSQLEVPISHQALPELPASRQQFDRLFEIRKEPPISIDEIYQHNTTSVTLARKRTLFASVPFAIPVKGPRSGTSKRMAELSRLETAKTWVRANVITPEESYRPADARRALERFGERLVRDAVQSLVTERCISMGNKGRITPGRNYDITDHFLAMINRRRPIDSTQLKVAVRFKTTILDKELKHQGHHEVSYAAEDGEILALINLVAEGRIILRPRDPPRDKYGLTDGGYLTRLIEKSKLRFTIEAYPVRGKYVYGNPIREKVSGIPPPRGDMDIGEIDRTDAAAPTPHDIHSPSQPFPGKVPLWFDVHRNFVKLVWDLAVAAVIGTVAIRPGISSAAIASMVKPSMGAWEVELLLEWMEQVGAVRHEAASKKDWQTSIEREQERENEPGWFVKEWWWLVLE